MWEMNNPVGHFLVLKTPTFGKRRKKKLFFSSFEKEFFMHENEISLQLPSF